MTYYVQWNIQTAESSGGNENSMNNASEGVGEVNYIPVATMDIEILEELGWLKQKGVPHRVADALNGCICRVINC